MAMPACVIVGFGPGIGDGVARAFGRAGYSLGLLARTPEKHASLLANLRSEGYVVELIAADASDQASLDGGLSALQEKLGGPEVLIYNAVAFRMAVPTSITPDQLVDDFRTNVAGALGASNFAVPSMRARGTGAVLFTGGGWALYPSASVASTAIGKTGLRHLALMLSEELAGTGVRAGTVMVMGDVARGTPFDPEKIGEAFLSACQIPLDQFVPEIHFSGVAEA